MISKKILISTIVVIALVQFITADNEVKIKTKKVKVQDPAPSKPAEPGMNPDEETAAESEKPKGVRHKILRPIKSFFWPIRYFWQKLKVIKSKVQTNMKKGTAATPEATESNIEKTA